jgi:DNA segregation ATPase FtsK/SpoIIIE-like protein
MAIFFIAVGCVVLSQLFGGKESSLHHFISSLLIATVGFLLGIYLSIALIINELGYLFYNRGLKFNVFIGYFITVLNLAIVLHSTKYSGALPVHLYELLISYFIYPLILFAILLMLSIFSIALTTRNPANKIMRKLYNYIHKKSAKATSDISTIYAQKKNKKEQLRKTKEEQGIDGHEQLNPIRDILKTQALPLSDPIIAGQKAALPKANKWYGGIDTDRYFFDQLKESKLSAKKYIDKKEESNLDESLQGGVIEEPINVAKEDTITNSEEKDSTNKLDETLLFNPGITEEESKAKNNTATPKIANETNSPLLPTIEKQNVDYDIQRSNEETEKNSQIINNVLKQFQINAEVVGASAAPSFTTYELKLYPRTPVRKVTELKNEIAYNLSTSNIRMLTPIPGKVAIGIELPNKIRKQIILANLIENVKLADSRLFLGEGNEGKKVKLRLSDAPHIMIAGSTGSGKSVCTHTVIVSLLVQNTPDTLKFVMIDPKKVELSYYKKLPYLALPISTSKTSAIKAIDYVVSEMERRYTLLSENGFGSAKEFNKSTRTKNYLPMIVLIIDEFADLMSTAKKDIEGKIVRIAQMGRAANIHLILATQRPTANVITGLIKANIPVRIAFHTVSLLDSRIILDTTGAETLLGKGDGLMDTPVFEKPMRFQCAFISPDDIKKMIEQIQTLYS